MSARDVLAASLWLIDREIAGAPLPHPAWETFRENDPETAMIYETQAGCHLSALTAAGYAVVPREPTPGMTLAANKRVAVVTPDGTWALGRDEAARTWNAMIAAATPPQEDRDAQ